jgi:N-acetylmuramoyl-L-alanine amidase
MLIAKTAFGFQVVIDPGHGGSDRGAHNKSINESDITLKVSLLLSEELKKSSSIKTLLTRSEDRFLTLEKRSEIGNKYGDLFLSIHVNSSPSTKARGHEVYFKNQLPANEDALLAAHRENQGHKNSLDIPQSVTIDSISTSGLHPNVQAIIADMYDSYRLVLSAQFAKELFFNWNGDKYKKSQPIRQAPFFVISNLQKPSALVELGYMSHSIEAQKLNDPEYQLQIAKGLAKAVISYKDFVDKNPLSSLK